MTFNFSRASLLDDIVYGAARPGYGSQRVDDDEVTAWIDHMRANGVSRVLCLLDDQQLAYYASPLVARYRHAFDAVHHLPIEDYGLPDMAMLDATIASLRDAEAKGRRVVVHCSAGMGRTGIVLSAWLIRRHGLDASRAMRMVRQTAREAGAERAPTEADGARDLLESLAAK